MSCDGNDDVHSISPSRADSHTGVGELANRVWRVYDETAIVERRVSLTA